MRISDQRSASSIALIKEAIIDRLQAQKPSTIGHGSLSEISFPLSQYAIVYIYNRICTRIFDLPNCPAALSLESSTCWFQLGSSLLPAWFQLGSSLVPAGSKWFQLVPAWFQLGSSLVPAGSSWFQLVPLAWFLLGSILVPAWFQFGFSLVPAWFQLGSSLVPACF